MSEGRHTEPGKRLYTSAYMASLLPLTQEAVEQAIAEVKLEPVAYLNDECHYGADAPGRIATWWGQRHGDDAADDDDAGGTTSPA